MPVLSRSVMSDPLQPDCSLPGSSVHGDSPGKNTGVGCHALLQVIIPIQGSNPGLPHCGRILYHLSQQGNPRILEWVAYPFSKGMFWPRNRIGVSCTAGRLFTSWTMQIPYKGHYVTTISIYYCNKRKEMYNNFSVTIILKPLCSQLLRLLNEQGYKPSSNKKKMVHQQNSTRKHINRAIEKELALTLTRLSVPDNRTTFLHLNTDRILNCRELFSLYLEQDFLQKL